MEKIKHSERTEIINMFHGSIRHSLSVSPRTGLVWASFLVLVLVAFLGGSTASPATANQVGGENFASADARDTTMLISNLPGGPTGDPTIDLSHGTVQTSFSLGGTVDNSSPAYKIQATYSSNVMVPVKAGIGDYQVGELGLGWANEHHRIVRMNKGTGRKSDDTFVYYTAGRVVQRLKYVSTHGDFETYTFEGTYQPTSKIQRFVGAGDSYWIVTDPQGLKHYYGGKWGSENPSNYSDDFKQVCAHLQVSSNPAAGRCHSGPIEYGVQWGDWVGTSQNPKNQTNIEVAWNLSRIVSITGQVTTLSYINDIQDVGRQVGDVKPKAFSRSSYLYRVQQESGAKTVLAYCAMELNTAKAGPTLDDEAQAAQHTSTDTGIAGEDHYSPLCTGAAHLAYGDYVDPHIEAAEPDGYQERMKRVYIAGAISFVAGNVKPQGQTKLTYDFLGSANSGSAMTKRILTAIQRQTYNTQTGDMVSTAPPTLFTYWGQDQNDGVSTSETDFRQIFHQETGAFYGAIKSITSPTGLTKTYTYTKQDLGVPRDFDVPSRIKNARSALFSDGYILLVGADSNDKFTVEAVEWTPRGWAITYWYNDGNYAHEDFDPYRMMTMQSTFFAFPIGDSEKIQIVSKNRTNKWQELPPLDVPSDGVVETVNSTAESVIYAYRASNSAGVWPSLSRQTHRLIMGDYRVNTKEHQPHVMDLPIVGNDGNWFALAVEQDRAALVISHEIHNEDHDSSWEYFQYALSFRIGFYDERNRSWGDFRDPISTLVWCLANTNGSHTEKRESCARADSSYATLRASFNGQLITATQSGFEFDTDITISDDKELFSLTASVDLNDSGWEGVDYLRRIRKPVVLIDGSIEHPFPYVALTERGPDYCEPTTSHCQYLIPFLHHGDDPAFAGLDIMAIDPDIESAGQLVPVEIDGSHWKGLASLVGDWYVNKHNKLGIHPDAPLKYQGTTGYVNSGVGTAFYSSTLTGHNLLGYVNAGHQSDVSSIEDKYDLQTANCIYVAFDGEQYVTERSYYNPNSDTGALSEHMDGVESDDRLSRNVYVNVSGGASADLGCVGPIALTRGSLTTYDSSGKREFHALYPRIRSDGTSVMSRSLGHIQDLGPNLTDDDIDRYHAIAEAQQDLKDLQELAEEMEDLNWVLMGDAAFDAILDDDPTALVDMIVMTAAFTTVSELTKQMADADQNTIKDAIHDLTTTHPDSNINGSSYSLYNTALVYTEPNGNMTSAGDVADEIRVDGKDAEIKYIRKYDPSSGLITFQTSLGPYARILVNGEVGEAVAIQTQDNMTAGEQNDYYSLGQGRNFVTYEKAGDGGKYTCLKTDDQQRLMATPVEEEYDDPCLFGTQGKVIAHRMIDEAGIGTIHSIVVDTVTSYDGLQTTKIAYDFDTATAARDGDSADYHKVTIYPGGRESGNGRIEQLMYNGVEAGVELECENLDADNGTYSACDGSDLQPTEDALVLREKDDARGGWKVSENGPASVAFVGERHDDKASVVHVADGYTAVLYQDANFAGKSLVVDGPRTMRSDELGAQGMDDEISSYKLYYTVRSSQLRRVDLRGKVYERSVYADGETEPQAVTQTRHKVQIIKRSGYRDAVRVFKVRTDSTRDDVTTVAEYEYNQLGQRIGTRTAANNLDQVTGIVREEVISASQIYAWETDAYGAVFTAQNRYTAVAQTARHGTSANQAQRPTQLLGSTATTYEQVEISGMEDQVYLPKRSYVYQADLSETDTPAFDPSQPGSGWIALGETTTYDGDTGIPTVTTNVQTGQVSSLLLTNTEPKIAYATFGNANVQTLQASYYGFESYADEDQVSNFTLSGGSIDDGYSGRAAYGHETASVSVTVDEYHPHYGQPVLLSARVRPKNGETCKLMIGLKTLPSQSGDGKTWQYLEMASAEPDSASVSCDAGGYIDDVLIRPVDASFSAKTHDNQYRTIDGTNNNGVVTHLVRDHSNRIMGSYQHDPSGLARLVGLPIAGFSRYWGYNNEPNDATTSYNQHQPNHSATVTFLSDKDSWYAGSISDGESLNMRASPRFALRALVHDDIHIEVGDDDSTKFTLTEYDDNAPVITLTQGGVTFTRSGPTSKNGAVRMLTWVVIDHWSAVFIDGKLVISDFGFVPLADDEAPVHFKSGEYSDVFIGQDPILSRSFHDGDGRLIQSQTLRIHPRGGPLRTTAVSQTLYDGWGKPSVQTKVVELDRPLGDYDFLFVTSYDWNEDEIYGSVSLVSGHQYPFTRVRYASSPLLRPSVQSLLPGDEFNIAGSRTEKFGYGSTHDTTHSDLLGGHDLYQTQNFLPYTDDIVLESTTITDKAGRTVSTKSGNEDHGGYMEWKYQYDYWTDSTFQETTAYTPNYNAGVVGEYDAFKNVSTTLDNLGMVKTSQEPDLSGHAIVISDNSGRPRFTRKSASTSGNIDGMSYLKYDSNGRITETGVLKNVSKTIDEYRELANDQTYPEYGQTCRKTRYLYDTDEQTGYAQPYLTGRLYGLVSTMNLIVDNPTDVCFQGEDRGKSYIFYQYDQRGHTIGVSEVTDTTVRNSAYQYNNLGTRTALVYPESDRMTADNRKTGFANLSANRQREVLFDSSDQTTVYYQLNVLGQLDAICDSADCSGTRYASEYHYDVYGKIVGNKLNNESVTQTREYDFQERLIKLETKDNGGNTLFAETLSYDPYQSGNIRQAEYTGSDLGDGNHRYDYIYDIWGRLVTAVRSNGRDLSTRTHKYEYTYDHNGNMLTKRLLGATDDDVIEDNVFSYVSGKNQLAPVIDNVTGHVRHFTHNDYGAVTEFTNADGKVIKYELNPRNDRVHRVAIDDGYGAEYDYDPLGRRISRVETNWSLDSKAEYHIRSSNGKCIDVKGGSTSNRANIQLYDCHLKANQRWAYDHGTKAIRGTGLKCIDVKGNNNSIGANVQLYDCHGNNNQKWEYTFAPSRITGLGGKCLGVDDNNVQLEDCNTGSGIEWDWIPLTQLLVLKEHDGEDDGIEIKLYEPIEVSSIREKYDDPWFNYTFDNKISAIVLADGYTVDLYDEEEYGGRHLKLIGPQSVGVEELTEAGLNDAISSYKLYATLLPAPAAPIGPTATTEDEQLRIDWDDPADGTILGYEYILVDRATKLLSDEATGGTGHKVATNGDVVVVGAHEESDGQGAAYIYTRQSGTWTRSAKLTASDGEPGDHFGFSVVIDEDVVAVGAYGVDDGKGAVYVYTKPIDGWGDATQNARLDVVDGEERDWVGLSVAIDEDTIVAGASGEDGDGGSDRGAAYIFSKDAEIGWIDASDPTILSASDGADADHFGYSVAISGDTIVVGALGDDDDHASSGSAYVFVKGETGWVDSTEAAKLAAHDKASLDFFGLSVAIDGDTVVVGAPYANHTGVDSGAVYVFTKPSDGWANTTDSAKLGSSDGVNYIRTGRSVAIDGDIIVAGSQKIEESNTQGAIRVYIKPEGGWADANDDMKSLSPLPDGASVSIGGGAMVTSIDLVNDPGSAYVYDITDWTSIPDSGAGGANSTSYTIADFSSDQQYMVALRAKNDSGFGPPSTVSIVPTYPLPSDLIAMPDDGRAVLKWTVGDSDIDQYQVAIVTPPSYATTNVTVEAGDMEAFADIRSLTNGTQYTFSVVVVSDGAAASEASHVLTAPAATFPATPTRLAAIPDENEVEVNWDNEDITVTGYQYSLDGGDTYIDMEDSGRDTSVYTITNLESDTEYTIAIRAVNLSGEGAAATITATTLEAEIHQQPPP